MEKISDSQIFKTIEACVFNSMLDYLLRFKDSEILFFDRLSIRKVVLFFRDKKKVLVFTVLEPRQYKDNKDVVLCEIIFEIYDPCKSNKKLKNLKHCFYFYKSEIVENNAGEGGFNFLMKTLKTLLEMPDYLRTLKEKLYEF